MYSRKYGYWNTARDRSLQSHSERPFLIYLPRNLRSSSTTDRRWTCCSQDSPALWFDFLLYFLPCSVSCRDSGVRGVRASRLPALGDACRRSRSVFFFLYRGEASRGERARPTVVRRTTPAELEPNEEEEEEESTTTNSLHTHTPPRAHTLLSWKHLELRSTCFFCFTLSSCAFATS